MLPRLRQQSSVADARQTNVLITGTPGTGKSTLAAQLAQRTGLEHVDVGDVVRNSQDKLHDGWDEHNAAYVLNEDALLDHLEPLVGGRGGCIVDHHSSDFYPERWFDKVVVLTCDNTVLYNRLEGRGYAVHKIQENVQKTKRKCRRTQEKCCSEAECLKQKPKFDTKTKSEKYELPI